MHAGTVTQYHIAKDWIIESWHPGTQTWTPFGTWSSSYEFQLARMLEYLKYVHDRPYMYDHIPNLRMRSIEGEIIPGELFV